MPPELRLRLSTVIGAGRLGKKTRVKIQTLGPLPESNQSVAGVLRLKKPFDHLLCVRKRDWGADFFNARRYLSWLEALYQGASCCFPIPMTLTISNVLHKLINSC